MGKTFFITGQQRNESSFLKGGSSLFPFFRPFKSDKIKEMIEFITKNEKETRGVARILAQEIIKKPLKIKHALIIGLQGELGAGKTTFVQAFAKGLGIKNKITSPTFVLIKKYGNFYHIDCYRMKSYKDILGLDFEEIALNPKNIILIEWAERIKKILKDAIWIKFEIISEGERKISIL